MRCVHLYYVSSCIAHHKRVVFTTTCYMFKASTSMVASKRFSVIPEKSMETFGTEASWVNMFLYPRGRSSLLQPVYMYMSMTIYIYIYIFYLEMCELLSAVPIHCDSLCVAIFFPSAGPLPSLACPRRLRPPPRSPRPLRSPHLLTETAAGAPPRTRPVLLFILFVLLCCYSSSDCPLVRTEPSRAVQ